MNIGSSEFICLIEKEIENYGVLKVTPLGKKFLAKPSSFKISKDNDFNDEQEEAPQMSGGSCAVDPALFGMLKDLRKKISKEEKLQVVEEVFGGKVSKEIQGFLNIIVAKERNKELMAIMEYFLDEVKAMRMSVYGIMYELDALKELDLSQFDPYYEEGEDE